MRLRHFDPERDPWLYRCPCGRPECDAPAPTTPLLLTLDLMREDLGELIIVESGPRCAVHNASPELRGAADSEHLTGEGADLRCLTSALRFKMLDSARRVGFRRLGIGKTFLHVGVDATDRVLDVAWTYYPTTKARDE